MKPETRLYLLFPLVDLLEPEFQFELRAADLYPGDELRFVPEATCDLLYRDRHYVAGCVPPGTWKIWEVEDKNWSTDPPWVVAHPTRPGVTALEVWMRPPRPELEVVKGGAQ